MKNLIILFLIFIITGMSSAQTSNADLNGKTFRGNATEITPPDVDRMPIVYDELIRFDNDKIFSEVLKIYSADDCKYTSFVDDRRMIALKVVEFKLRTTGKIDGRDVAIEFFGNAYGDIKLSGNLIIKYPDNSEIKFLVSATAE